MGVISDAAVPDEVWRELRNLRRRVDQLETIRRLEASTIGAGGLRVKGTGGITLQQGGGLTVEDGGGITLQQGGGLTVEDGGDILQVGGSYRADDPSGEKVFEVVSEPAAIFLRKELITQVAVEIFADRVKAATDSELVGVTSTSYADPNSPGSPGPSVTVDVITGLMIVAISAQMNTAHGATSPVGYTGVDITGPVNISPSDGNALNIGVSVTGANHSGQMGSTRFPIFTGLDPGSYTVTMKYRVTSASMGVSDRDLTVIAF